MPSSIHLKLPPSPHTDLPFPGALFTSLAPSTIAIACYFCVADLILISQCTYYNTINARRRAARLEHHQHHHHHHHHHHHPGHPSDTEASTSAVAATESSPLLPDTPRPRSDSSGLPGSHRRHEVHRRGSTDPLTRIITGEDDTPDSSPWLHNAVSLVLVWVVGVAGWFVSYRMGAWGVGDGPGEGTGGGDNGEVMKEPAAVVGMVLGYASAVCYLWYVPPLFFPSSSLFSK